MCRVLLIFFAALIAGCVTKPDPINELVANLSSISSTGPQPLFSSPFLSHPNLGLPETATPDQIIKQIFQLDISGRRITDYKILKVRQVRFQSEPEVYTAVLVRTNLDERVVLLRWQAYGWNFAVFNTEVVHLLAPQNPQSK